MYDFFKIYSHLPKVNTWDGPRLCRQPRPGQLCYRFLGAQDPPKTAQDPPKMPQKTIEKPFKNVCPVIYLLSGRS